MNSWTHFDSIKLMMSALAIYEETISFLINWNHKTNTERNETCSYGFHLLHCFYWPFIPQEKDAYYCAFAYLVFALKKSYHWFDSFSLNIEMKCLCAICLCWFFNLKIVNVVIKFYWKKNQSSFVLFLCEMFECKISFC